MADGYTIARVRPTVAAATAGGRCNAEIADAANCGRPTLATDGWATDGWEYIYAVMAASGAVGRSVTWRLWLLDPTSEQWTVDGDGWQTTTVSATDGRATRRDVQIKGVSRVAVEIRSMTADLATFWVSVTE